MSETYRDKTDDATASSVKADGSKSAQKLLFDIASIATPPCVVEIPDIGSIILRRWNVGTIQIASELIEQPLNDYDFAVRFFTKIGRKVPIDMPADDTISDTGKPILLTVFKALSEANLNEIATKYLEAEGASILDCISEENPINANTKTLKFQSSDVPAIQSLHSLIKEAITAFDAEMAKITSGFKPLLDPYIGKINKIMDFGKHTQKPLGDMLGAIKLASMGIDKRLAGISLREINPKSAYGLHKSILAEKRGLSDGAGMAKLVLLPERKLELPPNPIHETNRRLDQLTKTMSELVEVSIKQSELSQSLVNISTSSLAQSAAAVEGSKEASVWSKRGVWVAVGSMIIAIGAMAITHFDGLSTDKELGKLTAAALSAAETQKSIAASLDAQRKDSAQNLRETIVALQAIEKRESQNGEQQIAVEKDVSEKLRLLAESLKRMSQSKPSSDFH